MSDIELIAKIAPKNAGFTGMVNADQVIGGSALPATVEHSEWDTAYTHIGESGASHTYIDQAVTIAGTPEFASVTITEGTTSANAVNFGADVNLYRAAANELRTDDYLIVGGDIISVQKIKTYTAGTDGELLFSSTNEAYDVNLYASAANTLKTDDALEVGGNLTLLANLDLQDDDKILLGTGDDGEIYSNTDDLYIKNITQDKDIIFHVNDGGVDTELMRFDGTNSRIGINETNPEARLHVTASAGNAAILFEGDFGFSPASQITIRGATNHGDSLLIGYYTTNHVATIQAKKAAEPTALDTHLCLNPGGGNVGINLLDPDALLEIYGTTTQLKLSGGEVAYTTLTVDASGNLAIDPSGAIVSIADGDGLVIGNSEQVNLGNKAEFQVIGTDGVDSSMIFGRWSNDADSPAIRFFKSRDGTIGGNTIVADDDSAGFIVWQVDDGTDNLSQAALIEVFIDGTPGAGDTPGRMNLFVAEDGSDTATKGITILNSGNVGIGTMSPGAKLDIQQTTGVAGDILHLRDTVDTSDLYLRYSGAESYEFWSEAGGTGYNFLTLKDGTGNVGIGTTAPDALLTVSKAGTGGSIKLERTDGAPSAFTITNASSKITFDYINGDYGYLWNIEGNAKMSLVENGDVGIGTTGPLAKLHVDQSSTTAAVPTLIVDQADISEGAINFIASARGIITAATASTQSVRVELNGTVYRLALFVDA